MPNNQNISIYLPQELADRVAEAKASGQFDPKIVCKDALEAALRGDEQLQPRETGDAPEPGSTERAEALTAQRTLGGMLMVSDDGDAPIWVAIVDGVRELIETHEVDRAHAQLVGEALEGTTMLMQTAYELKYVPGALEATASIEAIQEAGGWIQSAASAVDGQILLLIAWPTEPS